MKRFWQGIIFGGLATIGAVAIFVPRIRNRNKKYRRRIVMNIPRRASALFDEGKQSATRLMKRTLR